LTGLTRAEFRHLLPAFEAAFDRAHPAGRTAAGRPRQRWPGGGRRSGVPSTADKLLFVLVYLKTYPLQAMLGQWFGISTPRANYWLHHLLPLLRSALDDLGVLPERDGAQLGKQPTGPGPLIIDGTERRRQRPKSPEKQARHYSGKKKTHTDKNVLVANASSGRVLFLSPTRAGAVNDKRIADEEGLTYPPGTTLYKDAGFQGYEPAVRQTCQAKKKVARGRADGAGEARQPDALSGPGARGACHRRGEAQPDRQRRLPQQGARAVRCSHGDGHRPSQPESELPPP
jgi:hypothetical protein